MKATVQDSLSQAIVEALSELGPVTAKRMFGGIGFWADGVMFALSADDVFYLKSDETTRPAFEAEGLGPFSFAKKSGQVTITSYMRAPERLLDDPDELADWAKRAIKVAKAKAKPAKATPLPRRGGRRAAKKKDV